MILRLSQINFPIATNLQCKSIHFHSSSSLEYIFKCLYDIFGFSHLSDDTILR